MNVNVYQRQNYLSVSPPGLLWPLTTPDLVGRKFH